MRTLACLAGMTIVSVVMGQANGQSPRQQLQQLTSATPREVHDYYRYSLTHDIEALGRVLSRHGHADESAVAARPMPRTYLMVLHADAFSMAIKAHPAGVISAPQGQVLHDDALHEAHLKRMRSTAAAIAGDGAMSIEFRRRTLSQEELKSVRSLLVRLKEDFVPKSLPGAKIQGVRSLTETVALAKQTEEVATKNPYATSKQLASFIANFPKLTNRARQDLAAAIFIQKEIAQIDSLLKADTHDSPPSEEQPKSNPTLGEVVSQTINDMNTVSESLIEVLNWLPLLPDYNVTPPPGSSPTLEDRGFIGEVLIELALEAIGIRLLDTLSDILPKLPVFDEVPKIFDDLPLKNVDGIQPPGKPTPKIAGTTKEPLGLGSTIDPTKGSYAPRNLTEQLAIQEAVANPKAGQILENVKINDPRWPADEGWVKMEQQIKPRQPQALDVKESPQVNAFGDNITVHYNYNTQTHAIDDFKIIDRIGMNQPRPPR